MVGSVGIDGNQFEFYALDHAPRIDQFIVLDADRIWQAG